jgi:hypothetical protein
MQIHKQSLLLALKNSAVMALLVLAVLGLFGKHIPEQTPLISLGYGIISFLAVLPVYYLSFKNRWNEGPINSMKRLYTPLLTLAIAMPVSLIYTSIAYGHNPIDFFVNPNGTFNAASVGMWVKYSVVAVGMVYIIQLLGASNEREIIINSAPTTLKKESEEEKKNPERPRKTVRLQGGTKSSIVDLDIHRFLYAESDANYLRINLYGDELETLSLRMTVKQFQDATASFPEIVRCHRAFVVNIRNVSYYEGASDKGELHFSVIKDTVPVSKTYAEGVTKMLQQS